MQHENRRTSYESGIYYEDHERQKPVHREPPEICRFFKSGICKGIEEGTVIEIQVTRPGESPVTANIKVQQSDLELMQELRELAK